MLAYAFILFAIAVRLLSGLGYVGTMGFVPLGAALLFFGSRLSWKHWLAGLPLLMLTDVYLFQRYGMSVNWEQGIVWAWYVGAFFLGSLLKGRVKPLYVGGAAVGSAVSFFLVSNFAVWLLGTLYPMTLAGLGKCYIAAIPFFRNGLASDLVFSAIFFGLPVLYARLSHAEAHHSAAA